MAYYIPDKGAVALQQPDTFTTYLSQRDLGFQIPVNFVTHPGVVLTAACFPHDRYDDAAFTKCLSNLLAVGFRRIHADVYWDPSRSRWSLCPVELGEANQYLTSSVSTTTTARPTTTQLGTLQLTGRQADVATLSTSTTLLPSISASRTTTTEPVLTTITLDGTTEATSTTVAVPTHVVSSGDALVNVGPYVCSPDADLFLLISILSGYLSSTELDLNATIAVLTLNLHAARSASDPTGSAQAPAEDKLPSGNELLSNVISSNTSIYLYTPDDLSSQRSDLNASGNWFAVQTALQPEDSFFTVDNLDGPRVSTPNGWPSESYIEIERHQRLFVGYGTIEPQMDGYNFSGDAGTIFPQNYMGAQTAVDVDFAGHITSGCFFNPNTTALSAVNSSWAITSLSNGSSVTGAALTSLLTEAQNLTACGISPILNGTLNNATADQNFTIYQTFVNTTIWSWEPNEPLNSSAVDGFNDYRCAALNATDGRWLATECSDYHYGACRFNNTPYAWNITDGHAPYDTVNMGCDDDSAFDVPRTALENTYLVYTWREWIRNNGEDDDESDFLLWLNFNDVNTAGCWVIGQNSTCPYNASATSDTREVIVPVIAGIIVGIIVILTILVKCAGNRQQTKRRRKRADDGWDYEGVPS